MLLLLFFFFMQPLVKEPFLAGGLQVFLSQRRPIPVVDMYLGVQLHELDARGEEQFTF